MSVSADRAAFARVERVLLSSISLGPGKRSRNGATGATRTVGARCQVEPPRVERAHGASARAAPRDEARRDLVARRAPWRRCVRS
jgi:hypothetical protein